MLVLLALLLIPLAGSLDDAAGSQLALHSGRRCWRCRPYCALPARGHSGRSTAAGHLSSRAYRRLLMPLAVPVPSQPLLQLPLLLDLLLLLLLPLCLLLQLLPLCLLLRLPLQPLLLVRLPHCLAGPTWGRSRGCCFCCLPLLHLPLLQCLCRLQWDMRNL